MFVLCYRKIIRQYHWINHCVIEIYEKNLSIHHIHRFVISVVFSTLVKKHASEQIKSRTDIF